MAKINLEQIQQELAPEGWKVLSEEYKNLEEELTFMCPEGHRVYAPWKKMRTRRECPVCKQNRFKEPEQKLVSKKPGEKRILALDQATHISGWSIFSDGQLLTYGIFETTQSRCRSFWTYE